MRTKLLYCSALLTFVLGTLGGVPGLGEDQPQKKPKLEYDAWMAAKLVSSQQILKSLTEGDFKEMEENARRMQFVHYLEQWLRKEDFKNQSGYKGQLHTFEFATKELVRNAEDRNMDGALKSFQLVTESCVRCHQIIRDPVEVD